MIKLSDYVMNFVSGLGVKHVFMLSGGGCMHLVDSVGKCGKLQFVCNLHEQACAIAAEAYGQYTNNIGVALVTTGPGGTNTLTGVAGAWLDSTPCLFLSGQVKRADVNGVRGVRQIGFQEIDIVSMVKPVTKYAVLVMDPSMIRYHLEKAVYLAKHGRPGPVWLDIPLDVQSAMIDENALAAFNPAEVEQPVDAALLAAGAGEAIRLLNQAERPVVLAGNGVRLSGAVNDFLELMDFLRIPVLTTWKAMDFLPEEHPLFAGRPGAVGQRGANFTQQNSDFIMTLGARLDLGQTAFSHENFARAARKVIVDVDANEIGKLKMNIDVPVCADAGEFIRELLRRKGSIIQRDRTGWLKTAKDWQARYPTVLPEYRDWKDAVSNYVLVDVLAAQMKADDLLIPGSSGACSEITMQAFKVCPGLRVLNTQGLGSMGFGIPAAIGGCLASGGRRTVTMEGDGGFVMNIHELEVVRRLNLPVKFFVLNNDGYNSIRSTQKNIFNGHFVGCDPGSGVTLPDVRKVAASFGIPTAKIENHSDIERQVRAVLDSEGPVVCEVMISRNQVTAPRTASMQKPDGSMVSMPMEDMFPYLPREEFLSNMLIAHHKGDAG